MIVSGFLVQTGQRRVRGGSGRWRKRRRAIFRLITFVAPAICEEMEAGQKHVCVCVTIFSYVCFKIRFIVFETRRIRCTWSCLSFEVPYSSSYCPLLLLQLSTRFLAVDTVSTTSVNTKISQQSLTEMPGNFGPGIHGPSWLTPQTLIIPWLSLWGHHTVHTYCIEWNVPTTIGWTDIK